MCKYIYKHVLFCRPGDHFKYRIPTSESYRQLKHQVVTCGSIGWISYTHTHTHTHSYIDSGIRIHVSCCCHLTNMCAQRKYPWSLNWMNTDKVEKRKQMRYEWTKSNTQHFVKYQWVLYEYHQCKPASAAAKGWAFNWHFYY